MLIDGHQIESPLDRGRLWDELIALETISQWSALEECVSTDSHCLEPTSSYLCTHHDGLHGLEASVEVTDYETMQRLGLRTVTPMAEMQERLELSDHLGGSMLSYSASASSSTFGPAATLWLSQHVNYVCERLEQFANRELA